MIINTHTVAVNIKCWLQGRDRGVGKDEVLSYAGSDYKWGPS